MWKIGLPMAANCQLNCLGFYFIQGTGFEGITRGGLNITVNEGHYNNIHNFLQIKHASWFVYIFKQKGRSFVKK